MSSSPSPNSLSRSPSTDLEKNVLPSNQSNDLSNLDHHPAHLEEMSAEELQNYQNEISSEFKHLSRQYIESRLVRINAMIEKLQYLIKLATANEKSWSKIYNFEVETINNIMTNTEDLIMVENGSIPSKPDLLKSLLEYEEELREIFKNLQLPFDYDDTFKYDNDELIRKFSGNNGNEGEIKQKEKGSVLELETESKKMLTNENLANNMKSIKQSKDDSDISNTSQELSKFPFPLLFNQIFQPHRDNLKSIGKFKDYQSQLIQNNSENNSTIAWKQYYHKVMNKRNELRTKVNHELVQLYKEKNNLNQEAIQQSMDQEYYKSLISISDISGSKNDAINSTTTSNLALLMKYNHDSHYMSLDNRLLPKNKIELSHLRRDVQYKTHKVELMKNNVKRHYGNVFGPDDQLIQLDAKNDIDDDIMQIRRQVRQKRELSKYQNQHGMNNRVLGSEARSSAFKRSSTIYKSIPLKEKEATNPGTNTLNISALNRDGYSRNFDNEDDDDEDDIDEEDEEDYDEEDDDEDDPRRVYEYYDEEYDVETEMTETERQDRQIYKNVLFQEQQQPGLPLAMAELPTLGSFPQWGEKAQ